MMSSIRGISNCIRIVSAAAWLIMLAACASTPTPRFYDDFAIVNAAEGDSMASLADQFLGDPAKGWMIAEFNQVSQPAPGQPLVVPLQAFRQGGLGANGYQLVPILAYHRFSTSTADKTIVTEAAFDAQMNYLHEQGYQTLSLDRFMGFLEFREQIPERSVLITIDDGFNCFYEIGYPILKKYGFIATLFVYPEFIGSPKALSWDQLRELAAAGFDVQSQGSSHQSLVMTPEDHDLEVYLNDLEKELRLSKQFIESELERPCHYLAYPYGDYSPLVAAMAEHVGYRAAFTVNRGGNPFFMDRLRLNRSVVYGQWDLETFKQNLTVFRLIDQG